MDLNSILMRAIVLQMDQQARLASSIERKKNQSKEQTIREFYDTPFEWSILADISGNLAFGFEIVAEGE